MSILCEKGIDSSYALQTELNWIQEQKALYLLSLEPNLIYKNSFSAMLVFSRLPRPNPLNPRLIKNHENTTTLSEHFEPKS